MTLTSYVTMRLEINICSACPFPLFFYGFNSPENVSVISQDCILGISSSNLQETKVQCALNISVQSDLITITFVKRHRTYRSESESAILFFFIRSDKWCETM